MTRNRVVASFLGIPVSIRQRLAALSVFAILLVCMGVLPLQLGAQTYCIPPAVGVPALPGPPIWWDQNKNGMFPELPKENDQLNDPRWQGALGLTYGTGG